MMEHPVQYTVLDVGPEIMSSTEGDLQVTMGSYFSPVTLVKDKTTLVRTTRFQWMEGSEMIIFST